MKNEKTPFQNLNEYECFLDRLLVDKLRPDEVDIAQSIRSNPDRFTEIFVELKPHEARRRKGQFFTPKKIANYMVNWVLEGSKGVIVDPGCGSGVFSELLLRKEVDKVIVIDKDPLCIKMTKARAKLIGRLDALETFEGDFIDFSPNGVIDGIVCNPPYVRHHELDEKYKEKLKKYVDKITGFSFDKLSGLHVHFFVKAVEILVEGGRMAFITSAEFLDSRYGVPLKRFLYDQFDVEALILFDEAFEGVMTTSCISLLVKNGGEGRARSIRMIEVREPREGMEQAFVKIIEPEDLGFQAKWSSYLYRKKLGITSDLLVKFPAVAHLKRGIATGGNDFFTFTRKFAKKKGLIEYSCEILKSPKLLTGFTLSRSDLKTLEENGKPTRLLYIDEETQISEDLKRYLQEGESIGVNRSYLCRHRNPWYKVDRRDPPDAFLTYMGRGNPRFIFNEAGALYLNNTHGFYIQEKIDESRKKALLLFLNAFFDKDYVRGYSKRYSGGMFKIEPKDLEETLILDPSSLSSYQSEKLSEALDKLDDLKRGKARELVRKVLSSENI